MSLKRCLSVPLQRFGVVALYRIAALGREMGVLDASMSAAVIFLAIATGVVFPTLFKLIAPPVPQPAVSKGELPPFPSDAGAT